LKRLYLLRHAKSSWDDPALADHERPLAKRGRRASKVIAQHLGRERVQPELVLCSSAVRTLQTLEAIEPAVAGAKVRIEPRIYEASAGQLIGLLRELPDEAGSAMLIGHNPGMEELIAEIARPGPELHRVRQKFPTAALATLELDGIWSGLDAETAELVAFVKPRELEA
jgi:phosphohistidine phosphatase